MARDTDTVASLVLFISTFIQKSPALDRTPSISKGWATNSRLKRDRSCIRVMAIHPY